MVNRAGFEPQTMKTDTLKCSGKARESVWRVTLSNIMRLNSDWRSSFWTRCGVNWVRAQRAQTKLISEPRELFSFIATPVQLSNMMFANDEVVWISCHHSEESRVPTLGHANEVIAGYVTTGARMHLYSYLDKLQDKNRYCDADSFVYIQPRNEPGLV